MAEITYGMNQSLMMSNVLSGQLPVPRSDRRG